MIRSKLNVNFCVNKISFVNKFQEESQSVWFSVANIFLAKPSHLGTGVLILNLVEQNLCTYFLHFGTFKV